MSVFDLTVNELRRLLQNPLSALAVLALMIVPLIYSGSYLYANQDPYGNLKNIPVAIVNADEVQADSFSQRFVDKLLESKQFSFATVDADIAKAGVESEKYVFALVVPAGFSDYFDNSSLASTTATAPKPQIELILSSTEGYIAQEIASQTVTTLKADLVAEVDAQIVRMLLGDISEIRSELQLAADGAKELADGLEQIDGQMPKLTKGVGELATGAQKLASGLKTLAHDVKLLRSGIKELSVGASEVAAGVDEMDALADKLVKEFDAAVGKIRSLNAPLKKLINDSTLPQSSKDTLLRELEKVDSLVANVQQYVDKAVTEIDMLADGADRLATGMKKVNTQMPLLVNALTKASKGADELAAGAKTLKTGVGKLATGISKAGVGADELSDKLAKGVDKIPDLSDAQRADLVDFATNPVDFDNDFLTKESTYAVGLAPFFIALCSWIGAYLLLILMRPFSARGLLANISAVKIAIGGWLAPAIIGVLQMITVFVGVCLIINLNPAHPVLLLLFMVFMSLVYLAILQLLIGLFDKIGLFIGLVLLVLQLTTAGGTFPWQTMPALSQFLHIVLPMSYSLDGIRQLAFDGSFALLGRDILILGGWFVACMALSTLAAVYCKRWSANRLAKPIKMG